MTDKTQDRLEELTSPFPYETGWYWWVPNQKEQKSSCKRFTKGSYVDNYQRLEGKVYGPIPLPVTLEQQQAALQLAEEALLKCHEMIVMIHRGSRIHEGYNITVRTVVESALTAIQKPKLEKS